jgi:hypothetical protein
MGWSWWEVVGEGVVGKRQLFLSGKGVRSGEAGWWWWQTKAVGVGGAFLVVVMNEVAGLSGSVDTAVQNKTKQKTHKNIISVQVLFCSIHLSSFMPRDSVHSLGCTQGTCWAGGGIFVSWMWWS